MKKHRHSHNLDDLKINSLRHLMYPLRYTLIKYVEARLGGRIMTLTTMNRVWSQISGYRGMDYED